MGSGLLGLRLTERLPYFLSGVGYPDCLVLGPEALLQGASSWGGRVPNTGASDVLCDPGPACPAGEAGR
jgi:hypothetical protein